MGVKLKGKTNFKKYSHNILFYPIIIWLEVNLKEMSKCVTPTPYLGDL